MKKMKNIMNHKARKYVKWVVLVIIAIILLYGFFFWLPSLLPLLKERGFRVSDCTQIECYGLMGDSFGVFNALFSGLAFFGVLITILIQSRDNRKRTIVEQYFKMLDEQQKVVDEINVPQARRAKKDEEIVIAKGRKAFVEFKIQLKYLVLEIRKVASDGGFELSDIDIADIAYAVFYYGSDTSWKPFMMEYLKDYKNADKLVDAIVAKLKSNKRFILDRPNHNYLSVYFRNMYNAIKLIDNSRLFNDEEKENYVKVLRSQLSNSELYILFFNLISRFGKKWIDNNYVVKYQLIQNLPPKYCDGYNPKDFFPGIKFEGEEVCLSPFIETVVSRS